MSRQRRLDLTSAALTHPGDDRLSAQAHIWLFKHGKYTGTLKTPRRAFRANGVDAPFEHVLAEGNKVPRETGYTPEWMEPASKYKASNGLIYYRARNGPQRPTPAGAFVATNSTS